MAQPRMTIHVQLVLRALLAEPGRELYGLEIMRGAGLPSGTVYPILSRLEAAGWLAVRAERIDPRAEKRPARRYYRLTPDGAASAHDAMARTAVQLAALGAGPALAPVPDPGPDASPDDPDCPHRVPSGAFCKTCQRIA